MNCIDRRSTVTSRRRNVVKRVIDSLVVEPHRSYAWAMRADGAVFYKGVIFTPVGQISFDTGCSEDAVDQKRYTTKANAMSRINGWNDLPYKPERIPFVDLVENWKAAEPCFLSDGIQSWAIENF